MSAPEPGAARPARSRPRSRAPEAGPEPFVLCPGCLESEDFTRVCDVVAVRRGPVEGSREVITGGRYSCQRCECVFSVGRSGKPFKHHPRALPFSPQIPAPATETDPRYLKQKFIPTAESNEGEREREARLRRDGPPGLELPAPRPRPAP